MVTLREFIEEALTTALDGLRNATDDLTHEQLLWKPPPQVNHSGYLLWHVARVEDNFIQRFILFGDEVWWANGWQDRFGYETRGIGTGFTPEQVDEVPIPDLDLLWGYLGDVRQHTLNYLSTLDWSTLPQKPREAFPPVVEFRPSFDS
jgi:hypothetical protein